MNRRMLYQALLGACLAVSAGGLAAQTGVMSNGDLSTNSSAQSEKLATTSTQSEKSATTTTEQTQEQGAQPGAQPKPAQAKKWHTAKAKSASHAAKAKSASHTAKTKSASHAANAESASDTGKAEPHAAKTRSASHTAKAKSAQMAKANSETSSAPDEQAYRQALRGCVTQKDESQRDSCLDQTIEKFHRNA